MPNKKILPVILCGGTGSRLWPMSRASYPKQYLSLSSNDRRTFLQKTQERLIGLENIEDPIIICNEEHRFIVAEQLREIKVKPYKIVLEPFGKNTAPAITIAALIALKDYENINLLILSADHEIKDKNRFQEIIKNGVKYSQENNLITFGVVPRSPATGYGYIQGETPFDSNIFRGIKIKKFIEKPDSEIAKKLIEDKCFTWNSGIFLFKANIFLEEIEKFNPKVVQYSRESIEKKTIDLDFLRLDATSFKKCPNISIDYAVLEKTNRGMVLPMDLYWSDVGDWRSVWENSKKDEEGNCTEGHVIIKKTKDSFIRSEDRLIVGIGLQDLIVIDTKDVLLVANKNNSQEIKSIVKIINDKGLSEGREHKKIFRPWGFYISVVEEPLWKVKIILVKPKEKLSLHLEFRFLKIL